MRNPPEQEDKDLTRRLCFRDDTEFGMAYRCALDVRSAWRQKTFRSLMFWLVHFLGDSPKRWHLVADWLSALAGEEKRARFHPTPSRLNVVRAYNEAYWRAARDPNGGVDAEMLMAGPTMSEVRSEFARLFPRRLLPPRQSIKKTLILLGLQLREAKQGRPRNSQPKVAR